MENSPSNAPYRAAHLIKEIGRGSKGSRDLSYQDARDLYAAMLAGRVSDLELGAIAIALRIKGESLDELAGFLDAAEASFEPLATPEGPYAPIVIPSYNGSRQMPNLTPLLALLLARAGAPVLMHGVMQDPNRVTSFEILRELGIAPASSGTDLAASFANNAPAFMTIETLAPAVAKMLALRKTLGLRNSTHTLVKILQPFSGSALRLTSYTHPEYLKLLTDFFSRPGSAGRGDVFLMRGTEGETVANAKRGQHIEWFRETTRTTLVERQPPTDEVPPLPAASDAKTTAQWIEGALAGVHPIPQPIQEQVRHCLDVARSLRAA